MEMEMGMRRLMGVAVIGCALACEPADEASGPVSAVDTSSLTADTADLASADEDRPRAADSDADRDGFSPPEDCDDNDPRRFPDASETCNGIDDDCDGVIDEDANDAVLYYVDADGDGFGNPDITSDACEAPTGFVENGSDCDDTESTAFPGGEEICDEIDNDCNGEVDEGLDETFYIDEDGDGFITGQELFSFIQLCFKLPSACGKELGELLEGKRLKLGGVSDVVSSLLAKYDLDGNDKIDLQEFSKLYPVLRVNEPES